MTIKVSFMDGTDWTEESWNEYARMLMAKNGYLAGSGSELKVIQNTPPGQNVVVGSGVAWIQGLRVELTAPVVLAWEAPDTVYSRIDLVVLKVDWAANTAVPAIHKGTAAASPTAPTPTQSTSVWELPLAQITVPANAAAIYTADITSDTRVRLYGTTLQYVIEGGGAQVTTGSKGVLQVPFGCTITGWTLIADQSGSAVVDIKKSTYAAYPTNSSIAASAKPTISTAQKAASTTLTGWTTTINENEVLEYYVDSCTTCTRLTLILSVTR
nr:hypothetical protein [uncultured Methanoregula sp.]